MTMVGILSAHATDYNYLTIEKSDGTALSLTALGLTITYADNQLTAANGTETATIALDELSRMYFSESAVETDDPGEGEDPEEEQLPTSVKALEQIVAQGLGEVYDLSGRRVPAGITPKKGIYIIKKNGDTKKVQVK